MSSLGNPAVALGLRPPAPPANPLGLVGSVAGLLGPLNANREFQQEFAARQRAGQIISQSPNLDTAIAAMKQDPGVAGFLPDIINKYQGLAQLTAQTTGARMANATNAVNAIMQALPSASTDETSFDKALDARLAGLPANLRNSVAPEAISAIKGALFDNLPENPEQRNFALSKRWNALTLSAGMSPAVVAGLTGTAENINTPAGAVPVVRAPGVLGGGVARAPGYVPFGIGPQFVQTPGGAEIPYNPNAPRNELAPGARGPAGAVGTQPGTGVAGAPATGTGAGATPSPQSAARAGAAAAAALPPIPEGYGGVPVFSQPEAAQAQSMMQQFSTDGVREFNSAQQSLGYLAQMDNDLDTLAKSPVMEPGTIAQERLGFFRGINTLARAFGLQPLVSPTEVASAEAANKVTNTLGLNLVHQFLGGQREAYSTIEQATQSVPGITNSYLGGKLLIESLRQTAQRAIDQRNFQQAWANQRHGSLAGSLEAFNEEFPPEEYADRALAKFGMTEKGFDSKAAILTAVREGYLTPEQAKQMAQKQFGSKTGSQK